MIVIPSVDIRGGKVVRLVEGREDTETVFGNDPSAWAERWVKEGAEYLHVVDLDGAFQGAPRNLLKVREIIQRFKVPIEFGGGVRETGVVETLVAAGVARIIIGSAIVDNRAWAETMFRKHPGRVAVGIDAMGGIVSIHGWKDRTRLPAYNLAKYCAESGASAVIYTDIMRDGKMGGPNLKAMRQMVEAVKIPVIASGGVTTADDLKDLAEAGCAGAIIGRALYEGRIRLADAMAAARSQPAD